MTRAILLAVDDDVNVLEALVRDLRQRYGADYRILRAGGGAEALATLAQLKERQEPVALLLSDQQMPGMTGVEFLMRARALYPEARRVLLTAFADTDVAVQAINTAHIHYYLNKPWDPPEEKLYPVLNDLLDDWKAGYRPPFTGLQLVGRRWSPRDHEIRNFLSRNHVPYRWFDAVSNPDAEKLLVEHELTLDQLPVVLFADGSHLTAPTVEALAERVGLSVQATQTFYDMVIVGGGPAGLAAAVYAASEGLKTLVVEPEAPGGQAGSTSRIENYLGFPSGLTGAELGRRAHTQAARLGAEFITQRAEALLIDGANRAVRLADGCEVASRVVLLATGVQYRRLEVPGAALVEATGCQGEEVFLVGGANSAGQAALHFAQFACKVTLLVRGEGLSATMSKYLIDEIATLPNIVLAPFTEVIEVQGEERLQAIRLRTPQGERWQPATSLFVFIGAEPSTEWLPPSILRDAQGFVLAGPDLRVDGRLPAEWKENRDPFLLETSVPGVFVAGDLRHGSIKRIASAVGEGSISVAFTHQYLAGF